MPTRKERVDEFVKLYHDEKIPVAEDLERTRKMVEDQVPLTESELAVNLKKMTSSEDYEAAYRLFNRAMEHYNKFASTKAYVDIMSKKYDAMVDDNNVGVYNDVHDPVIVFRANEALKKLDNPREISRFDMNWDAMYVEDELAKRGVVMTL